MKHQNNSKALGATSLLVCLLSLILSCFCLYKINTQNGNSLTYNNSNTHSATYVNVVEKTVESVVSINTIKRENISKVYFSPNIGLHKIYEQKEHPGLGSGVIIDNNGRIITNHHVIEGVDEIEVITHQGKKLRANVIGFDKDADIALLQADVKIPTSQLLKFTNSDNIKVGEHVLAIGNPFGLGETVTKGIISARDRQLSDSSNEVFQTDTVINPGNSGGPLVNLKGEIVGINVAIYSGQSDIKVWQGVGLAIPANTVKDAYERILSKQNKKGYLGIIAQNYSPNDTSPIVLEINKNSPAQIAGLLPGDIIKSYNSTPVFNTGELVRKVKMSPIDKKIIIEILRKGKKMTLSAVILEK